MNGSECRSFAGLGYLWHPCDPFVQLESAQLRWACGCGLAASATRGSVEKYKQRETEAEYDRGNNEVAVGEDGFRPLLKCHAIPAEIGGMNSGQH
jgi:hypothetical protein